MSQGGGTGLSSSPAEQGVIITTGIHPHQVDVIPGRSPLFTPTTGLEACPFTGLTCGRRRTRVRRSGPAASKPHLTGGSGGAAKRPSQGGVLRAVGRGQRAIYGQKGAVGGGGSSGLESALEGHAHGPAAVASNAKPDRTGGVCPWAILHFRLRSWRRTSAGRKWRGGKACCGGRCDAVCT